jgi:hypothetical protein
MPRLYGDRPDIVSQPDQNSGLSIRLNPKPVVSILTADAPAPADECTCDITGIFWGQYTGEAPDYDTYDQTSLTITDGFSGLYTHMPKAILLGDTCPGADTSGITASWVSAPGSAPKYEIVSEGQVWALVVTKSNGNGTLTVSGSIDCGGDTISVGPITLIIDVGGGEPPS